MQDPQPELDPQDVLVARRARVRDRHGEQPRQPRGRVVAGDGAPRCARTAGPMPTSARRSGPRPSWRSSSGRCRSRRPRPGDVGDARRREAAVEDRDARGLEDLLEALGAARVVARRAAGAAAGGAPRGWGGGAGRVRSGPTLTDASIKLPDMRVRRRVRDDMRVTTLPQTDADGAGPAPALRRLGLVVHPDARSTARSTGSARGPPSTARSSCRSGSATTTGSSPTPATPPRATSCSPSGATARPSTRCTPRRSTTARCSASRAAASAR